MSGERENKADGAILCLSSFYLMFAKSDIPKDNRIISDYFDYISMLLYCLRLIIQS